MPIPPNARKELISRVFVRIAANAAGCTVVHDELDFGTDLTLRPIEALPAPTGGRLFRPRGIALDVQIKSTTSSGVTVVDGNVKFPLEATAYNNLVRRRRSADPIPLVLVLFVLPDDENKWIVLDDEATVLRQSGFYWFPDATSKETSNTATKTIEVPLSNRVTADSFSALFEELVLV